MTTEKRDDLLFRTKGQLVYERIKNEIATGILVPGMRVSAVELAQKYGVSRTPVNDAVKVLADQGLVRILPNVGFEIMVLVWEDIKELMCLKGGLEKLTIRLALENKEAIRLEPLRATLREIRTTISEGDSKAYYRLTEEFHFAYIKLSRRTISFDMYKKLWDYESWYAKCLENKKDELFSILEDHEKLLDAIANRDQKLADALIDEHTENCIRFVHRNMESSGML